MITFITLSKDDEKYESFKNSFGQSFTPKLPVEFIRVDGTKFDLPSGYNYGAKQASYYKSNGSYGDNQVLIFVHDDARLWASQDRLMALVKKLEDPQVGFVGVAGTVRLSETGCWWQNSDDCRGAVYHPNPTREVHQNCWPPSAGAAFYGEVVVLDGLLLACTIGTFKKLGGFNEALKGFHFYDLDITLRAHLMGFKNHVFPLPIYHGSIGELSPAWEHARQTFCQTYATALPRSIF